MLDESSLELDFFLWFDFVFSLGRVGPSCFFVGFGLSTLSFSGFWVSSVVVSFFWRFGQSRFTGLFFLWQSRVANRSLSQLAMRGSGWALDTGIVFFFLQSSSRQLQLHGNRSWTEHCGNYSTDNLTLNITSRGLESYDTPHTCFFMIISKLSCSNVLINSYLFLITNAQTTLF